jgi:hypothetical protein
MPNKTYKIPLRVILLLILLFFPSFSNAEIIYTTHKYILGDNDSKNDARKMCFLEAKRKALEKAGTYIESLTEVKNARLTKDEVLAYSSALLKVETVQEDWKMSGGNMSVILKVKADVDTENLKKKLSNIRNDKSVKKSIIEQQKKLHNLEKTVLQLQRQLGEVDSEKAAILRKNRNVAFKEIDELEAKQIAIITKIKRYSKNAVDYIEVGMNRDEVKSLLGSPRSISIQNDYNYGKVWIIFGENVVQCIVKSYCFYPHYECPSYINTGQKHCIIK